MQGAEESCHLFYPYVAYHTLQKTIFHSAALCSAVPKLSYINTTFKEESAEETSH
jgi:hypothetical protein